MPQAAIFGSEELSRRAPGIASLIAPAAVRLHPEDAARLSLADGDQVCLRVGNDEYSLPARLDAGLARGVAVVPAGYPETQGLVGIARARVGKTP